MKQNKLLTIREVAQELDITEQQVIDLAKEGKIPAYNIGGIYLRFKPEHIQQAKQKILKPIKNKDRGSFAEGLLDFFYFNDFYILTALIIILMLIAIFKTR